MADLVNVDPAADGYFAKCWAPTWGRHRARMIPIPGNNQYKTPGAPGYYNSFDPAGVDPLKGYCSFDLGSRHVIVLNAECSTIGGFSVTSFEG